MPLILTVWVPRILVVGVPDSTPSFDSVNPSGSVAAAWME